MVSSGSDSDSDSGSGSSGSDEPTFHKKVAFRKTTPQQQQKDKADAPAGVAPTLEDVAVSSINRNLKRLEREQLHRAFQDSLVLDERVLCEAVDDADVPDDAVELLAWKRRELDRLHRDRNRRIAREEGGL
ncbi:hypothetical protein PICMEDRAFT_174989 [Pichia membranifaciens NRRL Y-2026]|uniref:Micro-fibrillar-associated protein 1 C-terminal domain-containing protein n=1 Tax=Pichia membranifaciens NRRL Y-2026 TaxID=763406 RepID=A0A1E3NEW7_9ASCO|nr:hypothetical protein PICMEDRAFT_174989 [Pichia membranifaciens NRRL Y-2026]ODQ44670.1 hypothetical protein PICMEDRAFT_174989 [Pichia membranifaciens NRRL Y-2026]